MSNTKTPDDKREQEMIAEQFEGLDNDLVNVGKFTDPEADPGSPDAAEDEAEKAGGSKTPASDTQDISKRG